MRGGHTRIIPWPTDPSHVVEIRHDGCVKVGNSRYAAIRPRGSGDELYGTYRYMPTWWLSCFGAAALVLLAPVVALVGGVHSTNILIVGLVGILGAGCMWVGYARPRLVVHPGGVTVVGSLRVTSLAWREIKQFDCQQCLLVVTATGRWIPVSGLPAPGLRRVLKGAPGPVDALAERLNRELIGGHDDATRQKISIATEEGRRDIRVLVILTSIGTVATGLARMYLS
jgi:hypothetical protein